MVISTGICFGLEDGQMKVFPRLLCLISLKEGEEGILTYQKEINL